MAADGERIFRAALVLPHTQGTRYSQNAARLWGALMASVCDELQVGDAICHEGSHFKLRLLVNADPVLNDDGSCRFESPWQQELRPLLGILRGVHAFANVVLYYGRVVDSVPRHRAQAARKLEEHRRKVLGAWSVVEKHARFTFVGELFGAELARAVQQVERLRPMRRGTH
jgi:HEXXH motif-containing protein